MIPARGPQTKLKCNPDLQAIEFPYNCSCLVGCHVNFPGGMQHTQNNILRARFTHAIVIFLVMHPPLGEVSFSTVALLTIWYWLIFKYVAEKKFMGLATMATSAIVHRCFARSTC